MRRRAYQPVTLALRQRCYNWQQQVVESTRGLKHSMLDLQPLSWQLTAEFAGVHPRTKDPGAAERTLVAALEHGVRDMIYAKT